LLAHDFPTKGVKEAKNWRGGGPPLVASDCRCFGGGLRGWGIA